MQTKAITNLMKNKIFIIIFCTTLIGCSKQKSIEDVFVTEPDEYWQYHTGKNYGSYIKFNQNNTSDYVDIEKHKLIIKKSEGDIELSPFKWFVSKDSILTWNGKKYDIVSYNDKLIILFIEGKNEADNKIEWGYVYLVKGTLDNVSREPGYYGRKRELFPKKYKEQ